MIPSLAHFSSFCLSMTYLKPSIIVVYLCMLMIQSSFCAGKNTKDIEQKLNDDLAFIDSWLTINSLFLHKDKTESVLFGSNGKLSKVDSFKIRVGDQVLKRVLEFKYLGVVFDENLSWNAHIKYIATKASKRIGLLKRTRKDLCAYSTNLAYTSFVRPVLEYCDSVWS